MSDQIIASSLIIVFLITSMCEFMDSLTEYFACLCIIGSISLALMESRLRLMHFELHMLPRHHLPLPRPPHTMSYHLARGTCWLGVQQSTAQRTLRRQLKHQLWPLVAAGSGSALLG